MEGPCAEHRPGMPAEPRRLPQMWLQWMEGVDMRMHEAPLGQRRGRAVWMLVMDAGPWRARLPGELVGVPKGNLLLLHPFYIQ